MLLVSALVGLGLAIRLSVAGESLFADELSTYWIIERHGLFGALSTVHSNAEITPPLYFVLSWLTTQIGSAPELVRAPSLVAGMATIPMVYLLGLRTVGRPAALVATALTTFSPFMIYYSAEARAYGLMMGLVVLSTLAMLLAVDGGRDRWWIVYSIASCAAVYSHYTCVFLLGAQLLWLLWAHPEARPPAILANLGALLAFLPWTGGVIKDFTSPTSEILAELLPFTVTDVLTSLGHWSIGYPYSYVPLRDLPGPAGLALLGLAVTVSAVPAAAARVRGGAGPRFARRDARLILVLALALSVPLGEAIASAVGVRLFGVRNLAASWPALALAVSVLLVSVGPRLRIAVPALAVAGLAVGATTMLDSSYQRPDYAGAADFIDRHAAPGEVVIDETGTVSPGPLTGLDVALQRPRRVFRAGAPEQRDRPFNFFDRVVPRSEAFSKAAAAADGSRIFVVSTASSREILPARVQRAAALGTGRLPARYRLVETRSYAGTDTVRVKVFAAGSSPPE